MSNMDRAIVEVVHSIAASVLGIEITETGARALHNDRSLAGCVQIMGAWSGAVILWCDEGFATSCAEILFEGETCGDAETRDALGELTNMVAGNLKALLPAPSHLSLPTVASGGDFTLEIPGSLEVETVQFELRNGQRLDVVLRATCEV